jgi:tyrosine-protein phosphatase SIW14
MPLYLRSLFGLTILILVIGGPLWYRKYRHAQLRNLRVVEPAVLYRSGQMTVSGLERVIHDRGIRTVVNLRDGDARPDQAEEAYCRSKNINYVRIIQTPWSASEGPIPAEQGLARFYEVMRDPRNHPVLLHCFAGHHRTGTYVALYRMEFAGWSNARALEEMIQLGYDTIHGDLDVCNYLQSYRPGQIRID